jgi:serine/threonine protein kinase
MIDGIAYIASELVNGPELQTINPLGPRYSPHQAAELCQGIADAIEHSHSRNVQHRDIKPENILLEPTTNADGVQQTVPRLTDFGLARIEELESGVSTLRQMVGTLEYMSPQQLKLDNSGGEKSSDIYAIGLLLYEMLTGTRPRSCKSDREELLSASKKIKPPMSLRPDIPKDLNAICMRCLAYEPEDRYRSSGDLKADLQRFLDGRPTIARPLTWPQRFTRWANRNRLAAGLMVLAASSMLIASAVQAISSWRLNQSNSALFDAEGKARETAWQYGLTYAYNNHQLGHLQMASSVANEINENNPTFAKDVPWQLLKAEIDLNYRLLYKADYPLRDIVSIPGTSKVIFGGDSSRLTIFDRSNGKVVDTIDTPLQRIDSLAISADGQFVAAGGATDAVTDIASPWLIDLTNKQIRMLRSTGPTTLEALAFSPDGKWLASTYRYEWASLESLKELERPLVKIELPGRGRSIGWLNDSKTVAVMVADGHLLLRGLDGSSVDIATQKGRTSLAPVPNTDQFVAAISHGENCFFIGRDGHDAEKMLSGSTENPLCIAVSPDGRFVAVGSELGEIIVWGSPVHPDPTQIDLELARKPLVRAEVFESEVTSVCWSDEHVVATALDGSVFSTHFAARATDYESGRDISAATFDCDGREVVIGLNDGTLYRYPTTELMKRLDAPGATVKDPKFKLDFEADTPVMLIEIAPSGKWMMVGYESRQVELLDASGKLIVSAAPRFTVGKPEYLEAFAISDDEKWIAWAGREGQLRVRRFDGKTLEDGYTVERNNVLALEFFPGSNLLAAGGRFEGLKIYSPSTPAKPTEIDNVGVRSIDRIPGTKRFAVGSVDGVLRQFDTEKLTFDRPIRVRGKEAHELAVSLDGKTAVWTDEKLDTTVVSLAWDRTLGQLRKGPINLIDIQLTNCSTEFSADGRYLMISHFLRLEPYHDLLLPDKPGLRRGLVRDFMRIYDLHANPDGTALTGSVENDGI